MIGICRLIYSCFEFIILTIGTPCTFKVAGGSNYCSLYISFYEQAIRLLPSSFVFNVFINTIFFPFAREVAEGSITWK